MIKILFEATGLPDGFHEVHKISEHPAQTFGLADPRYFGHVSVASVTWSDEGSTPWRRGDMDTTSGVSWLYNPSTETMRLVASESEADDVFALRTNRRKQMQADRASDLLDTDPTHRKLNRAIVKTFGLELKEHGDKVNALRQAILDATSLATLKSAVAAIPPITVLTKAELEQALKGSISRDD